MKLLLCVGKSVLKCQKLAAEQHLSANKLQAYFTNRIEKYINSKQREIIGWDEILMERLIQVPLS